MSKTDTEQAENIHPEFSRQLMREDKEGLLKQKGLVVWLVGLSGSGKSTIANALEKKLHAESKLVCMLDGDNLRSGINAGLGFSDEDREENIRRASEIAKLFLNNGAIVLVTLITPQEKFRQFAKEIIGKDLLLSYIKASFETCMRRDVKGLYAKQQAGEIKNFTGAGSSFEEPQAADLVINTEENTLEKSVSLLYKAIINKI